MAEVEFDKRIQIDQDATIDLEDAKAAISAFSDAYSDLLELCTP